MLRFIEEHGFAAGMQLHEMKQVSRRLDDEGVARVAILTGRAGEKRESICACVCVCQDKSTHSCEGSLRRKPT